MMCALGAVSAMETVLRCWCGARRFLGLHARCVTVGSTSVRDAQVCVCVTKELEIYYTVKLSYIYDRMGGGGLYSRVRCASKKDVDVSSFPFVEFWHEGSLPLA